MREIIAIATVAIVFATGVRAAVPGLAETSPNAGGLPSAREEPTQPTLSAAVSRGVSVLADRDVALMDAPAQAHLVLLKNPRLSDDLPLLDRVARMVAGALLERSLEVTVLESPSSAPDSRLRPLEARSVWSLSVGSRDAADVLRLRASTEAVDPVVVPFVDKPWIEDPDWSPAGDASIVFRGDSSLRPDAEEARSSALDRARESVLSSLGGDPDSVREEGWLERLRSRAAATHLGRQIESARFADRHVADRFVSVDSRSYGKMFRGHVLVAFTPQEYRELERKWQRHRQAYDLKLGVGGVALAFAIGLLGWAYVRIDAATKGYLTHWLRLIAVAGIGLLGGVLWWNLF